MGGSDARAGLRNIEAWVLEDGEGGREVSYALVVYAG